MQVFVDRPTQRCLLALVSACYEFDTQLDNSRTGRQGSGLNQLTWLDMGSTKIQFIGIAVVSADINKELCFIQQWLLQFGSCRLLTSQISLDVVCALLMVETAIFCYARGKPKSQEFGEIQ